MKYAIIQLQGKQYQVSVGDKLSVDRLDAEVGQQLEIKDVLLIVDGEQVAIGTPLVAGAVVKAKVLEHGRGEKIRVFKYKSKSRYRRTIGHRQDLTNLEITEIKK